MTDEEINVRMLTEVVTVLPTSARHSVLLYVPIHCVSLAPASIPLLGCILKMLPQFHDEVT